VISTKSAEKKKTAQKDQQKNVPLPFLRWGVTFCIFAVFLPLSNGDFALMKAVRKQNTLLRTCG